MRAQFYETPKVIAARERLYERGCKTHGGDLAEEQILLERFKEWWRGVKRGGGGLGPTYPSQADPVLCPAVGPFCADPVLCPTHTAQSNTNTTLPPTSSSLHKLDTTFN